MLKAKREAINVLYFGKFEYFCISNNIILIAMKVMKFGGTSVGTAVRIKSVGELVCDCERNFLVLSAMSGTTNKLIEI